MKKALQIIACALTAPIYIVGAIFCFMGAMFLEGAAYGARVADKIIK